MTAACRAVARSLTFIDIHAEPSKAPAFLERFEVDLQNLVRAMLCYDHENMRSKLTTITQLQLVV